MAGTVQIWYRKYYRLPPNDPLYLGLSIQDLITEYWAHHYDDLYHAGKLDSEFETDDFEREVQEFMRDDSQWETLIDE